MYIPLGFRFNPTDEELIRCFLYPKVMGLRLGWDGVTDRCVYGENAEPWNVFSDADDTGSSYYWHTKKEGGSIKKTIYVFTSITKSAPNSKDSKRAARIAGCGTWSGQTGPKDIAHNDTIGYSRMLTFKIKKSDSSAAKKMDDQDLLGHWIMHEYSLSDATLRMAGLTHNDIVLCKITRIIKKKDNDLESTYSTSTTTFQDLPQIQTAAAAETEAVQYYSPENSTTAGEEGDYDDVNNNNNNNNNNNKRRFEEILEMQLLLQQQQEGDDDVNNDNNKRYRGCEEEILEIQQQQQQQEGCMNIYDLPFVDFGEIDIDCPN